MCCSSLPELTELDLAGNPGLCGKFPPAAGGGRHGKCEWLLLTGPEDGCLWAYCKAGAHALTSCPAELLHRPHLEQWHKLVALSMHRYLRFAHTFPLRPWPLPQVRLQPQVPRRPHPLLRVLLDLMGGLAPMDHEGCSQDMQVPISSLRPAGGSTAEHGAVKGGQRHFMNNRWGSLAGLLRGAVSMHAMGSPQQVLSSICQVKRPRAKVLY